MKFFLLITLIFLVFSSVCVGQQKMKTSIKVPLNHFYIVVDSETYKAIETDDFLRNQFAVSEKRTTVRTDVTYTGTYFYGTNTYFEFFDEGTDAKQRFGKSGIAFGTDKAGQLETLLQGLSADFSLLPKPVTRQYNNKQVDWFYMAVPKNLAPSEISFWLMEYHKNFLPQWNSMGESKDDGVARKDILRRYADVLKVTPQPYLKDVVELTIALNEKTKEELTKLCQNLGYRSRKNGQKTTLESFDFTLNLVSETDSRRGITEIKMRVKGKPKDKTEFHFGKSVLKFDNRGFAIWAFTGSASVPLANKRKMRE